MSWRGGRQRVVAGTAYDHVVPATDPARCALISRADDEPMAGTAPVASRWLLIEHAGPWAKEPLDSLPDGLGAELAQILEGASARALLIRRFGRDRVRGVPRWYAVDCVSESVAAGTWASPEALLAAGRGLVAGSLQLATPPEPMVLVCTHGTRDACCAIFGRDIAKSLAAQWPSSVWECTHLGGHRFAATCLTLPDGVVYGRLDATCAVEVVGGHWADGVDPVHLRGISRLSQPAQSALARVLGELSRGEGTRVRAREVAVLSETPVEGDTRDVVLSLPTDGPDPGCVAGSVRATVRVTPERLPAAPVSCGAAPRERTAYRAVIRD